VDCTVAVKGTPRRNGSVELAGLNDVSEKAIINYMSPHYDLSTGIGSVDAQIQDVSKDTIAGPIKVRVISLESPMGGKPKILTSDNKGTGSGAIWGFKDLPLDRKLKPGEKSGTKHLEFSISDLPPLLGQTIAFRGLEALELTSQRLRP
jgi:hypothetical protein